MVPERIPVNLPALRLPPRWHICTIHILMFLFVCFSPGVFHVNAKRGKEGWEEGVVSEPSILIVLGFVPLAAGFIKMNRIKIKWPFLSCCYSLLSPPFLG